MLKSGVWVVDVALPSGFDNTMNVHENVRLTLLLLFSCTKSVFALHFFLTSIPSINFHLSLS